MFRIPKNMEQKILRGECKGTLKIDGINTDVSFVRELRAEDIKMLGIENVQIEEFPKVKCERHPDGKLTCNEHDKDFNQFIDHMPETHKILEQLELENASTSQRNYKKNAASLSSKTAFPTFLVCMFFYALLKFMIMTMCLYENSCRQMKKLEKHRKKD